MPQSHDSTTESTEELGSRLRQLRQQLEDLVRRLGGGDKSAYNRIKFHRHAMKQLEQRVRGQQKRERRVAWGF